MGKVSITQHNKNECDEFDGDIEQVNEENMERSTGPTVVNIQKRQPTIPIINGIIPIVRTNTVINNINLTIQVNTTGNPFVLNVGCTDPTKYKISNCDENNLIPQPQSISTLTPMMRDATQSDIAAFLEPLRVPDNKEKIKCKDLYPYFDSYCKKNLIINKCSGRLFTDTIKKLVNFNVINCRNYLYITGLSLIKDENQDNGNKMSPILRNNSNREDIPESREATKSDIILFLESLITPNNKARAKCKCLYPHFNSYCMDKFIENKFTWRMFTDIVKKLPNFTIIITKHCISVKGISIPNIMPSTKKFPTCKDIPKIIEKCYISSNSIPLTLAPLPQLTLFVNNTENKNQRSCKIANCIEKAIYGYEGTKFRYCLTHKLDGMVIPNMIYCPQEGCNNYATYGSLYSNTPTHCRSHSDLNEYGENKRNPICSVVDCNNIAHYIDPFDQNVYPIRCFIHRFPTDMELVKRSCPNCQNEVYFPSNNKICMNCGLYRNTRLQKFKENIIKYFLQSNNISVIHNKSISHIGSKHKPDFLIMSIFGYIILEVDEDQHRYGLYVVSEINRMKSIYFNIQSINEGAQVLFVRYNPDKYKGLQQSTKERHSYLYTSLCHLIKLSTIGTELAQIKLYYDKFDGKPQIIPVPF